MSLTYDECIKLINDLPRFTTKHSPDESRDFLRMLGDPHKGMRIIHVAGTNGKGSVCVYMESVLIHSGMKTGCFISPHLVDMRERVRLNGKMCSIEQFTSACSHVAELAQKTFYPSFFEFLFFVSMLIFKDAGCEIVILETGLGGRLDATNIPENKELAVITGIGKDHMQYLGNTLGEIAAEKAGILRPGVPAVYWGDDPEGPDGTKVHGVIHETAVRLGSVEYALDKSIINRVNVENGAIDFWLSGKYDNDVHLHLNTGALYQTENASLAVTALLIWDKDTHRLKTADITEGVASARWEGRMEEISPGVFLDGAHNEPGMRAFLRSVASDGAQERMLVFGCMKDKQYDEEIKLIVSSGLFNRVCTVSLQGGRAMDAGELVKLFTNSGMEAEYVPELKRAYSEACAFAEAPEHRSYIAGSLYLVGSIKDLDRR